MLRKDTCRSAECGAEILWVWTHTGARMPLDPLPIYAPTDSRKGLWVFYEDDRVRPARPDDEGPFFESHFASCPDAPAWRGHTRS